MSAASVTVLARPGSKSLGVVWHGARVTVRVRERALDGKANEAIRKTLAAALGVAPSRVALTRGARAKQKTFEVAGLSGMELAAKLAQLRA